MRPSKPCSECGNTKFAYVKEAKIEIIADRLKGWGNVHHPAFSICTCLQCGHTKFFGITPGALPEEMKQEIIEVTPSSPYR